MIKLAVNLALILLVSCRIMIQWFPLLGVPVFSTAMAVFLYLCLLYCIIYTIIHKEQRVYNRDTRLLFILYVIYSLYLIYYIVVSPQIPRDDMQGVPEKNFRLMQEMLIIGIIMFLANTFKKFVNVKFWARTTVLIILFTSVLYFMNVNIFLYAIYRNVFATDPEMLESFGMIDGLSMDRFMGICFFCNLWLKGNFTRFKIVNIVIFLLISGYCFVVVALIGQRGPLLFLFTTLLFYLFCKEVTSSKKLYLYIVSVLMLLCVGTYIVSQVSEDTVERFEEIGEDGGSGRFGDEESEFNLAWSQIEEDFFVGSYFRTTANSRLGDYPHNLILEFLMTFGFLFSLPLFYIIFKSVKTSFIQIRNKGKDALFCLIYIFILSCFMTSGTVALNTYFWLLLTLVVSVRKESYYTLQKNGISISNNNHS